MRRMLDRTRATSSQTNLLSSIETLAHGEQLSISVDDMEHDVHSTSESGYLKTRTQETQTDINTKETSLQTDAPKTIEKGVQTSEISHSGGTINIWLKCAIGMLCIIVCGLILYTIASPSRYSNIEPERRYTQGPRIKVGCEDYCKDRIHDKSANDNTMHSLTAKNVSFEEENKNLTAELQILKNEQSQLKTNLELNNAALNKSEATLKKYKEDISNHEYENRKLKNKAKQCDITNKDLEEQITHCKKAVKDEKKIESVWNPRTCESKNEIEEFKSSNDLLKKQVSNLESSQLDLKQTIKRTEESKQIVEEKLESVKQEVLKNDRYLQETQQRLDKSADEIDSLNSNVLNLKEENQNLTEILQILQTEQNKMTTTLELNRAELNQSVTTLQKYKKEVENLERVNKELNIRTEQCEIANKDLLEKISNCDKTVSDKEKNESIYNSTICELRNKTKQLGFLNEVLKKQVNNLETSQHDLKQEIKHTEQSKRIVENELESVKEEVMEKDRDLKETRQLLETAEAAKNEQKKLHDEAAFKMTLNEKKVIELQNKDAKLNEENENLKTQNENCETSLSELMAATGSRDNIKLSKMEDYSHEKLAVEFREIYDEEYTNADDELRELQNVTKVNTPENYLLQIVKLAYELCSMYATEHKRSINDSVTSIDVKTHFHHEKQKYKQQENGNSSETVHVSIYHLMSTLDLDDVANLTLSTAMKLQEPIIKVLSEIIVSQFEIEPAKQPNMLIFIHKCLKLCWMMNMHPSPIFLKFEEVTDLTLFDTRTYKTYLKAGKYLDYVVWPPLHSHEGGKLISKGIAQGKE